jgi:hypothetical protein
VCGWILLETGWCDVELIGVVHDQGRALVDAVMNVCVP